MSWRERIESMLRTGMRYCFRDLPGDVDEQEFSGENGFLHHVQGEIRQLRKEAFAEGWKRSCLATVEGFPELQARYDEVEGKVRIDREWEAFDRE